MRRETLLFSALAFSAMTAWAQQPATSEEENVEKNIEITEVVVTGTRN